MPTFLKLTTYYVTTLLLFRPSLALSLGFWVKTKAGFSSCWEEEVGKSNKNESWG